MLGGYSPGTVKPSINQDLNCTRSLLLPTQLVWPHKATQHSYTTHAQIKVCSGYCAQILYAIESLDPRSRESLSLPD